MAARTGINWIAIALTAASLAACGGSDKSDPPAEPSQLALGTFNTGLISVVKGRDARKPEIVDAIVASKLDVLCLQELFDPIDAADFAESVEETFPHSHYSALGDSNFGNGLMILSRYPLQDGKALLFDEADPLGLTDRMVISADLELEDGSMSILCTHVQAGLGDASIAVRSAQLQELVTFAEEQGYLTGPTVVLGDFNMGPDPVENCTPDSEPACLAADVQSYEQMLMTFDDPAADWAQCTQCRDVFLPMQVIDIYADEPDQRIDHCFTRNLGAWSVSSTETIFDDTVSIEADGETLTSLSDHIGVRCNLQR